MLDLRGDELSGNDLGVISRILRPLGPFTNLQQPAVAIRQHTAVLQ